VPVPPAVAAALPVVRSRVLGEGWFQEPRGVAVAADGTIAVADVGLSAVVLLDVDGTVGALAVVHDLDQPEAVAWTSQGLLAVADTWGQGAVLIRRETGAVAPLPEPEGGWWGPRGIAVAPSGDLAVADTGNKRLVAFSPGARQMVVMGGPGSEPGQLVEPGGVAFTDDGELVVCDTGNHRLQVFDRAGAVARVIDLAGTWSDFYSRPHVALIAPDLWVVTDPPARALVVIEGDAVRRVDLGADGISPAGVAFHDGTLYVTDLERKLWAFDF
jgi:DNA-binding beta-propeller fold protein YncE